MTKKNKLPKAEQPEVTAVSEVTEKKVEESDVLQESITTEPTQETEVKVEVEEQTTQPAQQVVVKKTTSIMGVIALLVALGVGGASCYYGQKYISKLDQKIEALSTQNVQTSQPAFTLPENLPTAEDVQTLVQANRWNEEKITLLQKELLEKNQAILDLQGQINRLGSNVKADKPNDWLMAQADFLLSNALRKMVLDSDVDTAVSLLKLADEALEKVSDPKAAIVRQAINADIKQLSEVNNVDQNAIMQQLSKLANNIDELQVLDVNFGDETQNAQVSNSLSDWQSNLEKSANSFLNHFIRITPKTSDKKELLAPNQDIYLRENIRLRLQIAILAVPREQNDLYKQSLEVVSSWIRSYFDTESELAKNYLKVLDELAEQSIFIDVPNRLSSLEALDKVLNKQPSAVQKIEISADKALQTQDNATPAAPVVEKQE